MSRNIDNLPVEQLVPDALFNEIRAAEGGVQVTSAIVILAGFDAEGEPWLSVALDDKITIWDIIGRLEYVKNELMFPEDE